MRPWPLGAQLQAVVQWSCLQGSLSLRVPNFNYLPSKPPWVFEPAQPVIPATRTREYLYPQHRCGYLEGTGTGSPELPQGYPCDCLHIKHLCLTWQTSSSHKLRRVKHMCLMRQNSSLHKFCHVKHMYLMWRNSTLHKLCRIKLICLMWQNSTSYKLYHLKAICLTQHNFNL